MPNGNSRNGFGIFRITKTTFNYLYSLTELYLQGNAISVVAGDAFRLLKELKLLDLSRNHFEQISLEAFKPLEAQIQSIRTDGKSFSICQTPKQCG